MQQQNIIGSLKYLIDILIGPIALSISTFITSLAQPLLGTRLWWCSWHWLRIVILVLFCMLYYNLPNIHIGFARWHAMDGPLALSGYPKQSCKAAIDVEQSGDEDSLKVERCHITNPCTIIFVSISSLLWLRSEAHGHALLMKLLTWPSDLLILVSAFFAALRDIIVVIFVAGTRLWTEDRIQIMFKWPR